ncbi:MAG TPA: phosphate acetyltransferase [bacterium]|nr:phosphate acetyltransferase [bacterium]HPS31701.1 phosphate acetyltransferase [bacterium]
MDFIRSLHQKAIAASKTIVLPEGSEPRTLKAAEIITREKLAKVILVGNENEIRNAASKGSVNLAGIKIIDPEKSEHFENFSNTFFEMRKAKGVTEQQAAETMKDTVYFATMMVHKNLADGLVSGAIHSTGDTIRPALQIIKTKPGIKVISSSFVMLVPDCTMGNNGMFVFGDCAVNINPTASELAEIAISSAGTAKVLCGMEPKIAMLSFSTHGSAKHEFVDKVTEAVRIIRTAAPDLKVDGDIQADAAIVASVGKTKCPDSKIAGEANVLIFPDLQSGNIGYKLVQRLAKAEAVGPFLQGIAKPINDLSRGCSVEDIVNVVAITAVQATSE